MGLIPSNAYSRSRSSGGPSPNTITLNMPFTLPLRAVALLVWRAAVLLLAAGAA